MTAGYHETRVYKRIKVKRSSESMYAIELLENRSNNAFKLIYFRKDVMKSVLQSNTARLLYRTCYDSRRCKVLASGSLTGVYAYGKAELEIAVASHLKLSQM